MQGEAVLGLEAASACAVLPGDKCLNPVSGWHRLSKDCDQQCA